MMLLNDLERQELKRNHRLIKRVRLERAIRNAKQSLSELKDAYLENYEGDGAVFEKIIKWLEGINSKNEHSHQS